MKHKVTNDQALYVTRGYQQADPMCIMQLAMVKSLYAT